MQSVVQPSMLLPINRNLGIVNTLTILVKIVGVLIYPDLICKNCGCPDLLTCKNCGCPELIILI